MRRLLAIVLLLTLGTATPAFAHAGLVSSDPPDGALLTQAPSQVSLTFNEELLERAVSVSVRDSQDQVLLTSVAEAAGTTVIMGWPAEANSGTYRLAYRVVSADGHPVTGEIAVTIDPAATDEEVSAALTEATSSSGLPSWVLVVFIGLFVGIAIGLFTAAFRRKRV
jgi:methionine-rich copper-binding protein CopC